MSKMFCGCSSLEEINLSNFNTENVINMNKMFNSCFSLKEINLSNFDTNNVIEMENMFENCSRSLINKIKAKYKNIRKEAFF